jgi:diadenosine tetraphosphate (Ap4A) HIT family hydrolase
MRAVADDSNGPERASPTVGTPLAGCLACNVNAGRIASPGGPVYDDGVWRVDHEITPLVRGYLVMKPLRHVHEAADLTDEEAESLGTVMRTVLAAARAALRPERIYICSFAETEHHLHFHLIPRYADMPGLGPELMPKVFSGAWACTVAHASEAAADIRGALQIEPAA